MSKRELLARELDGLSEQDLDKLPAFSRPPKEAQAETAVSMLAAGPAAKDWLLPLHSGCMLY